MPKQMFDGDVGDPEEDDPVLEAAWPHLQVVYDILLKLLQSPVLSIATLKPFFDTKFTDKVFFFITSNVISMR